MNTTKHEVADANTITAYKGFDSDMKCRGFQFEVGKTYEHDGKVEACESGFHACEYPLDVFSYYPPSSRFAVVNQAGDLSRQSDDSKVASRFISIVEMIDLEGIVKKAIEYTTSRCKTVDENATPSATGDRGAASATGNRGAASATGDRGAASATGVSCVAISSGESGLAKAAYGCAIVLVSRALDGSIAHIRASKVGENGIKPDVWYSLDENGEFVEVNE